MKRLVFGSGTGGNIVSEDGQETKRILCTYCAHLTTHVLRARYSLRDEHFDIHFEGEVEAPGDAEIPFSLHRYSIWQCAGCNSPSLEYESGAVFPGNEGDTELSQEYFPKRSVGLIRGKGFRKLGPELTRLYQEIIACFNNNCFLLCTIGLRALIEGICDDKGIDGKLKFERRIDDLIRFLPSVNVIEALHELRIAGNGAAHHRPLDALTSDEAREAIAIMEDLLNFLYELDYKALKMSRASKRAALKSAKLDSVQ